MIWKQIPSFPDYEINKRGSIRKDGKPIKLGKTYDGYVRCVLKKDGRSYSRTAHPLVLDAFVGPRPPKHDACHSDGNPANNRLENLRWDTRKNNVADSIRHGTNQRGTRHWASRLTEEQVLEIRKEYASGISGLKLAKKYGVCKATVYHILSGAKWKFLR